MWVHVSSVLYIPTWLALPSLSFTTVPFEMSLYTPTFSLIIPEDNVFNYCDNSGFDMDESLLVPLLDISLDACTTSHNSLSISCSSFLIKSI